MELKSDNFIISYDEYDAQVHYTWANKNFICTMDELEELRDLIKRVQRKGT